MKVSDFDAQSQNSYIDQKERELVGTELYLAPEVIGNSKASFASDLWALGIIAFQVFTGKTPFMADSH